MPRRAAKNYFVLKFFLLHRSDLLHFPARPFQWRRYVLFMESLTMSLLKSPVSRTRRAITFLEHICQLLFITAGLLSNHYALAQEKAAAQYRNPVLFADYSDPDIIRDGKDYYLINSSFHFVPAIPILHSVDLVNWEIAGHVLQRLELGAKYDMIGGNRYGGGVWAPSVRFHNGLFYIYFPTPDEGIFVTTAPRMTGPWSKPIAVIPGPGWEDPCPFWDDDGTAYLVHSKLHAGPLFLHRMSADGKSVLDEGKIIVQDPVHLPTLEGPKFYKRNGWYYIFAPMGGVGQGSQAVLRSRNIYGPYDYRIVLEQGQTSVDGPHQGGYVETPDGRGWFLHFSLHGAHGRIVYLEPVRWEDDWPVIGEATAGVTTGQPVARWAMPVNGSRESTMKPQTSDEFNERILPPMWEWNHNPDDSHWSLTERPGFLRLHMLPAADLMHARNTLTESMQDDSLEFTTEIETNHMRDGDHAGLSVFDKSLNYVAVVQTSGVQTLQFSLDGVNATGPVIHARMLQLRAQVFDDTASYFFSIDGGHHFQSAGKPVHLGFGWWKGARPAIFAFNTNPSDAPAGFVDVNWARYRALQNETQ